VLGAVPSEVPQTICTAKDIYTDLHDKLTSEINKVVDSLGSLGWLIAPNVKVQQEFEKKVRKPLEKEVKKAVGHVAGEVVTFLANRELANLLELIGSTDRITDARLNGIYATDDSKSRLLEMADVAARVRRDAGLNGENDNVSEDRFPALYNAIVLSKLALLDADILNAIYHDLALEIDPQAQPRKLFTATAGQLFNILQGAVSSIDGNQQWQAIGLPYPVSSGKAKGWPEQSRFGRPGSVGSHSGFLLWGDSRARETAFKQLFKGPLNPGMESHPAMLSNYPFPACERHPFPSTTRPDGSRAEEDYTCRLMTGGQEKRGNYPALSERVVKPRELAQLGLWELRVARNEIFARHGYRFGPHELERHFAAQSWYSASDAPSGEIVGALTAMEWHNLARIARREDQLRRAGAHQGKRLTLSA
jgi:YARHG domain